jgi:glutamate racemase
VLERLIQLRPDLRYLYVADTDWMPYGTKASEVIGLRLETLHRLVKRLYGANLWVMGCNTASAALPWLEQRDPNRTLQYGKEFVDLIRPTLQSLFLNLPEDSPEIRVALLATPSTVQTARYEAALRQYPHQFEFCSFACPSLAEAVEGKLVSEGDPLFFFSRVLEHCLTPVRSWQPHWVILACTHYLHIQPQIQAFLGEGPQLINPAQAVAEAALPFLPKSRGFTPKSYPKHWLQVLTTSEPEAFDATLARLPLRLAPYPKAELLTV